ncbi:MAG: Lrp/AsnC family transcriptional regulator [Burkholderiaceae bacterium]|nr:MAG: Lrp/AsnC family transcriptional regulator [Burkholderiaceae bacterium]
MTKPLDRIDLKILAILQQDGRITNQALSEQVNLSARACLERVKHLEQEGFIIGYRAAINPLHLPHVTVLAEVTLKDQRQTTMQEFQRRVRDCPEVIACYLVSGQYDYLLRFACPSIEHYRDLTNRWIDDLTLGVARIVSNTELQTIKEFTGLPLTFDKT